MICVTLQTYKEALGLYKWIIVSNGEAESNRMYIRFTRYLSNFKLKTKFEETIYQNPQKILILSNLLS